MEEYCVCVCVWEQVWYVRLRVENSRFSLADACAAHCVGVYGLYDVIVFVALMCGMFVGVVSVQRSTSQIV